MPGPDCPDVPKLGVPCCSLVLAEPSATGSVLTFGAGAVGGGGDGHDGGPSRADDELLLPVPDLQFLPIAGDACVGCGHDCWLHGVVSDDDVLLLVPNLSPLLEPVLLFDPVLPGLVASSAPPVVGGGRPACLPLCVGVVAASSPPVTRGPRSGVLTQGAGGLTQVLEPG